MDNVAAFLLTLAVIAGLAFGAGSYLPQTELANDCVRKGEIIINKVVYGCTPVAGIVNGKRVKLEEPVKE